jgi:hypothetical protein
MAQALIGLVKVGIVIEGDFLFFDGAHGALGVLVLRRFDDSGQTDLDPECTQRLKVCGVSILNPLVGVMDVGPLLDQCPLQSRQREGWSRWRLRCQPRMARV